MTVTSENVTDARPSKFLKVARSVLAVTLTVGSLAWSADVYRGILLLPIFNEQFYATMMGLSLALVYVQYPLKRGETRTHVPWYDVILGAAGLVAGLYVGWLYEDLTIRLSDIPADALIVSTLFFVLSIEGLRRTVGYSLVVVVLVIAGYAMVGHLVPGDLQTREIQIGNTLVYLGLDTSALFGIAMTVATTIVITFIFFGQLLMRSGGSNFFNDISLALMGRYRGGSAKIAITASSLFGSVSGVAVSNIVATGVVTIPMMKKAGFTPKFAAAVEAVASTGGQLMPPVMGAVAFLMADFLEMPYREIVFAALVPSILYYVALFIQADLEAARSGISRVPESEIPAIMSVMRTGWVFIVPFAVLIYALFWLNWLPETAALVASAATVVAGLLFGYQGRRMKIIDIWKSLVTTGVSVLDIMMIVAAAGFIIGLLQITGLGFALTLYLVELGEGSLLILLLMSAVLCIILGMGMPTVGVYILLAIMIAPALVEVGIPALAAHMFILYLGMMSLITPPVAVAAFFAASLAGAPPMATGWTSMRFGWTAYVVPFLFVFSPSLLLQGDNYVDLTIDVSSAIGGVWLVSAAMIGFFIGAISLPMRGLFLLAGILLLLPKTIIPGGGWTNLVGAALAITLVTVEIIASRKQHAQAA